jgi:hypothetical protein
MMSSLPYIDWCLVDLSLLKKNRPKVLLSLLIPTPPWMMSTDAEAAVNARKARAEVARECGNQNLNNAPKIIGFVQVFMMSYFLIKTHA